MNRTNKPRPLKAFDKRVDSTLIANEGLTGRATPFDPVLDIDYADSVERAFSELVIPMAKPLPVGVTRDSGNPKLSYGSSGAFDEGSLRDCCIWYARNRVWMLYTGATTPNSPYNPTIGLASSTDLGVTWTKHGQVIAPNPTSGQWNSGAVFSPGVWYDEATDELWVYVSGTVLASQWYSGPISIGVKKCEAGADWLLGASYVWQNAGNPILLPQTQGWESTQGVYSCTVKHLSGKWVMLYSSANSVNDWKIGRAVADRPEGPYTKDAANPVLGVTPFAEEADMLVLPGGTLIALSDDLSAGGVVGGYGIGVWVCSSQDGLGTWSKAGQLITTGAQTFDAVYIGSSSGCLLPNGELLIAYNGKAVAGAGDARTIGTARGKVELNIAGTGGGGTTNITYTGNVRGTASFNASTGAITDLSLSGVITGITLISTGVFEVTMSPSQVMPYFPLLQTTDDGVNPTFCCITGNRTTVTGTTFRFVTIRNGAVTNPTLVVVAVF